MKKKFLLAMLCVSMVMIGCGKTDEESAESPTGQETQDSAESASTSGTEVAEEDPDAYYASLLTGETLSEDELSALKDTLLLKDNNSYLYFEFRTPEDVDWEHAGYDDQDYEILAGALDGDTYQVVLEPKKYDAFNQSMNRLITFTLDGDKINPISNRFLWEENCIEEQCFDIQLKQFDGDVRFVTIPPYWGEDTDEKEHFRIIENGYGRVSMASTCSRSEGNFPIETVLAVDTLDFNFDGEDDIAVFGKTAQGYELELYEAAAEYEYYANGKWASYYSADCVSDTLEKEIGGFYQQEDVFPAVKRTLLGKTANGTFADYQEAYRQVVDNCEREYPGEYRFDLIYMDDDDLPELVVDVVGYNLTVYSMKDGLPFCVMPGWGYGAMGNAGYEYAEKTGWLRNYDQDFAGAISYTSFLTQDENGHFEDGYVREQFNFDDKDGDGYPSDEELEHSFEDGVGSISYYVRKPEYHLDDSVKDLVEEIDEYDFVQIGGTYTYPEMQEKLGAPDYEIELIEEHGKEITIGGKTYKLIGESGGGKVSMTMQSDKGSFKQEADGQNYLLYYVHRGDEKGYLYFCAMSPEGGNSLYIYNFQREDPEKPVLYKDHDKVDYAFAGSMTDAKAFELAHTCDLWGQMLVKNTFYVSANGNPVTTDKYSRFRKGQVKTKVDMDVRQSDNLDANYIHDETTLPAGTILSFYRTDERDTIDFLTEDNKVVRFKAEKKGDDLELEYKYSMDDFEMLVD